MLEFHVVRIWECNLGVQSNVLKWSCIPHGVNKGFFLQFCLFICTLEHHYVYTSQSIFWNYYLLVMYLRAGGFEQKPSRLVEVHVRNDFLKLTRYNWVIRKKRAPYVCTLQLFWYITGYFMYITRTYHYTPLEKEGGGCVIRKLN